MGLFSFGKSKPKPSNTTSRNSAFYLRENHIMNLESLKNTLFYEPDQNIFTTFISKGLSFAGIPIEDITPEKAVMELGTPSFVLDNFNEIPGHIVYFFRQNADLYRFLFQIHFINDRCFFIKNKISTSATVLTSDEKNKIISKLLDK